MDMCFHAAAAVLVPHDGEIAVAWSEQPPITIGPAAGHVEPADGLLEIPTGEDREEPVFRSAAVRNLADGAGFLASPSDLDLVLTHWASDGCRRASVKGGPRGQHLWRVYLHRASTRPYLLTRPGQMRDWQWFSPGRLLDHPDLDAIWRTLLPKIDLAP